ncbi:MAG TPA: hypothetical protein VNK04_01220 [Gemmataceae bacterium]|nr:hypothetical protein [Gemmataceae bacterium]
MGIGSTDTQPPLQTGQQRFGGCSGESSGLALADGFQLVPANERGDSRRLHSQQFGQLGLREPLLAGIEGWKGGAALPQVSQELLKLRGGEVGRGSPAALVDCPANVSDGPLHMVGGSSPSFQIALEVGQVIRQRPPAVLFVAIEQTSPAQLCLLNQVGQHRLGHFLVRRQRDTDQTAGRITVLPIPTGRLETHPPAVGREGGNNHFTATPSKAGILLAGPGDDLCIRRHLTCVGRTE